LRVVGESSDPSPGDGGVMHVEEAARGNPENQTPKVLNLASGQHQPDAIWHGDPSLERLQERHLERGELREDLDLMLAHELLFGPIYYRLLLSGSTTGPTARRPARRGRPPVHGGRGGRPGQLPPVLARGSVPLLGARAHPTPRRTGDVGCEQ
jgi:hypothetical protein